jgi:hypothetical protein
VPSLVHLTDLANSNHSNSRDSNAVHRKDWAVLSETSITSPLYCSPTMELDFWVCFHAVDTQVLCLSGNLNSYLIDDVYLNSRGDHGNLLDFLTEVNSSNLVSYATVQVNHGDQGDLLNLLTNVNSSNLVSHATVPVNRDELAVF